VAQIVKRLIESQVMKYTWSVGYRFRCHSHTVYGSLFRMRHGYVEPPVLCRLDLFPAARLIRWYYWNRQTRSHPRPLVCPSLWFLVLFAFFWPSFILLCCRTAIFSCGMNDVPSRSRL
jgi:hypothetical protein